jgi:hypothetical protein
MRKSIVLFCFVLVFELLVYNKKINSIFAALQSDAKEYAEERNTGPNIGPHSGPNTGPNIGPHSGPNYRAAFWAKL